ncbi:hypothetical protein [Nonomuraea insulae]|uniref:Uncharacterized protein n=1 Tax=Nonomuraea insulae TaxID=1616787 RepID=A0ABW1DE34_9ACTN
MTDEQRLVAWGDELIKLHDGFRRDLANLRSSRTADLRTQLVPVLNTMLTLPEEV